MLDPKNSNGNINSNINNIYLSIIKAFEYKYKNCKRTADYQKGVSTDRQMDRHSKLPLKGFTLWPVPACAAQSYSPHFYYSQKRNLDNQIVRQRDV